VTVGVVDTGVGPHKDLTVAGGRNTVIGEQPDHWADNGAGHGTHVRASSPPAAPRQPASAGSPQP